MWGGFWLGGCWSDAGILRASTRVVPSLRTPPHEFHLCAYLTENDLFALQGGWAQAAFSSSQAFCTHTGTKIGLYLAYGS